MSGSIFDKEINRYNTWSLKFDFAKERGKPEDAWPMWVADMDFASPACVTKALAEGLSSGVYGYSEAVPAYYEAVRAWFLQHYGWETENKWIVKTPGVVFAIGCALRAFTAPGDAVLIQTPVYYPFFEVIADNNRRIVENGLHYEDGRYTMDFDLLEKQLRESNVRMMILCSPHNPVGRVWTADELRQLGALLKRYGVVLVSDEIHCDIVYGPHRHHVFPRIVPEMAEQTVVCTSPGKTFNLAGLQVSNIFIQSAALRRQFQRELDKAGYSQLNLPGLIACRAAYEGGGEWLADCLAYLQGNLSFLETFVKEKLPGVRAVEPEGTYFAWLDFRELGLDDRELESRILHRAKLWLDSGYIFGKPGRGFARVVYACPRSRLEKAMEQMRRIC